MNTKTIILKDNELAVIKEALHDIQYAYETHILEDDMSGDLCSKETVIEKMNISENLLKKLG